VRNSFIHDEPFELRRNVGDGESSAFMMIVPPVELDRG
jgi:hypothetical protein